MHVLKFIKYATDGESECTVLHVLVLTLICWIKFSSGVGYTFKTNERPYICT